jgi:hypothetical protein
LTEKRPPSAVCIALGPIKKHRNLPRKPHKNEMARKQKKTGFLVLCLVFYCFY